MSATVLRLITEPEITINRKSLVDWLTANGINADDVLDRWLSIEVEDGRRLVQYRAYRRTADGLKLVDPDDSHQAWTGERTTTITTELLMIQKDLDHHTE